jgi:hypothetical protein
MGRGGGPRATLRHHRGVGEGVGGESQVGEVVWPRVGEVVRPRVGRRADTTRATQRAHAARPRDGLLRAARKRSARQGAEGRCAHRPAEAARHRSEWRCLVRRPRRLGAERSSVAVAQQGLVTANWRHLERLPDRENVRGAWIVLEQRRLVEHRRAIGARDVQTAPAAQRWPSRLSTQQRRHAAGAQRPPAAQYDAYFVNGARCCSEMQSSTGGCEPVPLESLFGTERARGTAPAGGGGWSRLHAGG